MKTKTPFTILATFSILALAINIANADITGSKHDFSGSSWNDSGEICNVCHTPHNADSENLNSPLWNHRITTQTFTLYTSPTMEISPEPPRSPSKACLSCHDGTIALDSFGGNTEGTTFMTGNPVMGADLSNDHPVSLKWQHQTLLNCSNCLGAHNSYGYGKELVFFDGYIECATCHDVHNGTGFPKMLRKTSDADQICFHCHAR